MGARSGRVKRRRLSRGVRADQRTPITAAARTNYTLPLLSQRVVGNNSDDISIARTPAPAQQPASPVQSSHRHNN